MNWFNKDAGVMWLMKVQHRDAHTANAALSDLARLQEAGSLVCLLARVLLEGCHGMLVVAPVVAMCHDVYRNTAMKSTHFCMHVLTGG